MNAVRVAQLLRELADAIEEDVALPATRRAEKRVRRAPTLTRPDGEAPDGVAGQARRILRERGFA